MSGSLTGDAPSIRAQLSRQCDSGLRLVALGCLDRDPRGDQGQHQEPDEPSNGEPQPPDGAAQPHLISYGERSTCRHKGLFLRAEVRGEIRPGTQLSQPAAAQQVGVVPLARDPVQRQPLHLRPHPKAGAGRLDRIAERGPLPQQRFVSDLDHAVAVRLRLPSRRQQVRVDEGVDDHRLGRAQALPLDPAPGGLAGALDRHQAHQRGQDHIAVIAPFELCQDLIRPALQCTDDTPDRFIVVDAHRPAWPHPLIELTQRVRQEGHAVAPYRCLAPSAAPARARTAGQPGPRDLRLPRAGDPD